MDRLADVISLPARRAASTLAGGARSTYDNVVVSSRHMVDDWGRDPDFVARIWSLSRLRWDVAVNGHDRLPKRGGALIVVSTRRFALAPVFAALSIGGAIGRPVRFVGRPDIAPLGPLMQRLGGLLDAGRRDRRSIARWSAGRDGCRRDRGTRARSVTSTTVSSGRPWRPARRCSPRPLSSVPFLRSARVEIGPDVRPDRRRRGPLTELELADSLESAIQQLLDELGGPVTGTPLDWLPLSVLGSS